MDLRDLETFIIVARTLSFSRAARELHLTQPAVSQRINKLESELRAKLLRRTTREVSLTGEGRRLLTHAESLLRSMDGLEEKLHRSSLDEAVRIGMFHDFDGSLSEALGSVSGLHVDVDNDADPAVLIDRVTAGELDACYTYLLPRLGDFGGTALPEALHAFTLLQEPIWVVVSKGNPLAGATAVTVDDVSRSGAAWHLSPAESSMHDWEREFIMGGNAEPRFVGTTENVLVLSERGELAGLGSPAGGSPHGSLVAVPLTPVRTLHHLLVWHPQRMSEETAFAVVTLLRASYRSKAQRNAKYWNHIHTHPRLFPGIALLGRDSSDDPLRRGISTV